MRHPTLLATATATATLFAIQAHAETDPGAVLRANQTASGGTGWNGKAVLRVESALAGQGLTGTDVALQVKRGPDTRSVRVVLRDQI